MADAATANRGLPAGARGPGPNRSRDNRDSRVYWRLLRYGQGLGWLGMAACLGYMTEALATAGLAEDAAAGGRCALDRSSG